jgi:hypothetical protein
LAISPRVSSVPIERSATVMGRWTLDENRPATPKFEAAPAHLLG